ncbi:MAG: lipoyl synthase [Anaplasmataceae bacterium]|nr:lipoyl synthase [Anaplasmataceae bacterium]
MSNKDSSGNLPILHAPHLPAKNEKEDLCSSQIKSPRLNTLPANPEGPGSGRFPSWLHRKLPHGGNLFKTNSILEKYRLNTVCEEAKCPNRFECYTKKTATFLALGKACTRNCGFCDIDFSKSPALPETDEPIRIASSVSELGLKHAVITMVARDDLPDGGASHLATIIREIRAMNPGTTIEILTSDFSHNFDALHTVLNERPEIFNHNLETVRSLTPRVRHRATYDRTLSILAEAKRSGKSLLIKSGIMVGLGEREEEVLEAIKDLYQNGCDIVTIGHYLQANLRKLTVKEFITPEQFKRYETYGLALGIKQMYCGPFVRSSYNAQEILNNASSTKLAPLTNATEPTYK